MSVFRRVVKMADGVYEYTIDCVIRGYHVYKATWGLCTKNEEQPKLGVRYSNSKGMGLLQRWVVVRIACLPWPVEP